MSPDKAHLPTRPTDETAPTRWMLDHLTVIAVPFEDADALRRLATDVLVALDPPLTLQGVSPTPMRRRITAMRGSHYR